jgi:prepilin-type N-terminal cleavage/methylation domain-containing protein
MTIPRQSGFSMIELMVGLVVSSIVLAGAYALWNTQQEQGSRLAQKISIRNELTLSSKRIQRSVTLAGIGLGGAANLAKEDAVGSDTLIIYSNPSESRSGLAADYDHGSPFLLVTDGSVFANEYFVAIKSSSSGEIRRIVHRSGSVIQLESPFLVDYKADSAMAFPAKRERYYSNQQAKALMRENTDGSMVVARDVTNFQVSFRNKRGESTEKASEVRTVLFSVTGVFKAREGALNSIVYSSTAIPRNAL